MSNDAPKDGFDLIEFPCQFAFKAMCRAADSASDELRQVVANHVQESDVVNVTSSLSRTGKFESITLTVSLQNRDQLESIYHSLSACSKVIMTL